MLHHTLSYTFISKDIIKTTLTNTKDSSRSHHATSKQKLTKDRGVCPSSVFSTTTLVLVLFFLSKGKPPVKLSCYNLLKGVEWENGILGSGIL